MMKKWRVGSGVGEDGCSNSGKEVCISLLESSNSWPFRIILDLQQIIFVGITSRFHFQGV